MDNENLRLAVIARTPIRSIVEQYVTVNRRVGTKLLVGDCPFHNCPGLQTFRASMANGTWWCLCDVDSADALPKDVVAFMARMHGMPEENALETLAIRAGIVLAE